jgi:hypothetical protein
MVAVGSDPDASARRRPCLRTQGKAEPTQVGVLLDVDDLVGAAAAAVLR